MFFIIYYLMGILGTVRMLWETFFQESDFAVFLNETVWISLLFVFCHWVIRRWKGSRWILFCLPAVLVLMGRGVFALTERIGGTAALSSGFEILYQSIHITSWNHFYPGDLMSRYVLRWDTSDYLAFGIVLAIFALLLYLAAVVKGSRMGVVFLLALPLAAVLAVGETPSLLAMSLVVFCCIGIFAGNRAYPLRALGATAAGLVLLGVSCVLVLPGSGQMEERKLETRQWVRETFTFTDFPAQSVITLPNFPGLSENPGELTNEDNIRYTGNQVAEVVTWNQPEETVYLRNYYGSEYTGHGWDARETEEEDAFAAAEYLEEIRGETIQQEMEISLYDPENGSYVPYFSDLSWQSEPAGLSPTTGYRYFPRERYLELMGQASQSEREDAWRSNDVSIREDEYLQWPEELRSLKQICDENPMEDIGEIRQFIVSWLAQNCSYNLQVGRFPEDEDPIEYFLFERKEGYCQHFASAAVMMFRMYGVPARYATGLAVQADLFENNGGSLDGASHGPQRSCLGGNLSAGLRMDSGGGDAGRRSAGRCGNGSCAAGRASGGEPANGTDGCGNSYVGGNGNFRNTDAHGDGYAGADRRAWRRGRKRGTFLSGFGGISDNPERGEGSCRSSLCGRRCGFITCSKARIFAGGAQKKGRDRDFL